MNFDYRWLKERDSAELQSRDADKLAVNLEIHFTHHE